MLPGGYNFIHFIFWTTVLCVILGTNFMAIFLSASLMVLLLESLGKS
jgi:hypothetical protein